MKYYFVVLLSIIAVVFSIIAVCLSWNGLGFNGIDIVGVVLGVAGLIVTALIGWNIYTVIDFNKIKSDTEKINKEIETRVNNIESKVKADMTFEMIAISNFYQSITTRGINESITIGFKNFKNISNESIAKSLWREWILLSFINFVDKEDSAQDLISYLKQNVPLEERKTFISEFLTYTEEEKETKYKGVQELLLLLVNNCICDKDNNKPK